MRSELVFRSPSNGAGWEESWQFTGRDESVLHGCLAQLDRYLTPVPVERWEGLHQHVIEADDRWLAAMLVFPENVRGINHRYVHPQFQADQAWTKAGARRLAEILPEELADLQASIKHRFTGAAS